MVYFFNRYTEEQKNDVLKNKEWQATEEKRKRKKTRSIVSTLFATLSLIASCTSAVIAIVIYTDIQITPEACDCTQREIQLLYQKLAELIEQQCAAAG